MWDFNSPLMKSVKRVGPPEASTQRPESAPSTSRANFRRAERTIKKSNGRVPGDSGRDDFWRASPRQMLTDFSAGGHFPCALDLALADEENLVVHVDTGAHVVGNHGDYLAHMKLVRGIRDVQMAVFLV